MTATTKFKARAAILECLREEHGLAGVAIDFYLPEAPKEAIILGPTVQTDDTAQRAMTQLPVKQNETYEIVLHLQVGSQADTAKNEARADELLETIMTFFAATPRLGLESYGFASAQVTRTEIVSGVVKDEGPRCRVDLTIQCKGRI